jgi:hypothetical protein
LERINKELKRRTRVVGAFPSDQSFMRLSVSILIDINEEWMITKRYLTMACRLTCGNYRACKITEYSAHYPQEVTKWVY